MTKVSIKKNVKPKTLKQKQRQTQKQNVTVNIGTGAIKKRGRQTKKAQPAQSISQPIIQSYYQPIFKPPIPQQSSLASTILATQLTPKVVAEEAKEQTSLKKALQEQNTDEPVTKKNDLERVRGERIKKFEKPVETIAEEPTRHALLSQSLADQQDDTEEIQALTIRPTKPDIPFVSSVAKESFITPAKPTSKYVNALRGLGLEAVVPSKDILSRSQQRQNLLSLMKEEKDQRRDILEHQNAKIQEGIDISEESQREAYFDPFEETVQETPLKQPEQRGASELVTQTETTESQPLTQATVELGFSGLTEEPIQTSVGQLLPPEPVSQNELALKGRNIKLPSLLKPVEPPPPITEPQVAPPTILQGVTASEVRAPDQYTTEQLVKDEPPGGAPLAQAEAFEQPSKIESEAKQIEAKWQELKDGGFISSKRTTGGRRKTKEELLGEINGVNGYEKWAYIVKPNKPGPKLKPTIAEEIQVSDL
jgi:hypothetical protein